MIGNAMTEQHDDSTSKGTIKGDDDTANTNPKAGQESSVTSQLRQQAENGNGNENTNSHNNVTTTGDNQHRDEIDQQLSNIPEEHGSEADKIRYNAMKAAAEEGNGNTNSGTNNTGFTTGGGSMATTRPIPVPPPPPPPPPSADKHYYNMGADHSGTSPLLSSPQPENKSHLIRRLSEDKFPKQQHFPPCPSSSSTQTSASSNMSNITHGLPLPSPPQLSPTKLSQPNHQPRNTPPKPPPPPRLSPSSVHSNLLSSSNGSSSVTSTNSSVGSLYHYGSIHSAGSSTSSVNSFNILDSSLPTTFSSMTLRHSNRGKFSSSEGEDHHDDQDDDNDENKNVGSSELEHLNEEQAFLEPASTNSSILSTNSDDDDDGSTHHEANKPISETMPHDAVTVSSMSVSDSSVATQRHFNTRRHKNNIGTKNFSQKNGRGGINNSSSHCSRSIKNNNKKKKNARMNPKSYSTSNITNMQNSSNSDTQSISHSESSPILSSSSASAPRPLSRKRSQSLHKIHSRQQKVAHEIDGVIGKEQPKSYRDILFMVLFFTQLGIMLFLGLRFGPEAKYSYHHDAEGEGGGGGGGHASGVSSQFTPDPSDVYKDEFTFTSHNVIMLACFSGMFSILISTLALSFMTYMAEKLIQIALFVAMGLAFSWGTIGTLSTTVWSFDPAESVSTANNYSNFVPITGIAVLGLITAYTFVFWDRIPFAAANLKTALTAVRSRLGVVGVAFGLQILALIWTIFYTFTCVGIYDAFHSHVMMERKWRITVYIGLGLSFYWNFQLLLYVVHVTVAGVVKDWWFQNGRESAQEPFSSKKKMGEVLRSFLHASTHAFGSVCLGSLTVGLSRFLRRIAKYFHPYRQRDVVEDCINSCVDFLGSKFNRFAFIYIGLYGYSFLEAGEQATALLKKRGWKKIVTDNLITDVLLMVSLVIGGVTGCFAVWIEEQDSSSLTSINHPTLTSFLIGSAVGLVLSSVLFCVISSSVNAVIILFAAYPVEFEENHPELSHEMREAWRKVFPGRVDNVENEESFYSSIQRHSIHRDLENMEV